MSKRETLGKQAKSAQKEYRGQTAKAKTLKNEAREHDKKSKDKTLSAKERGLHSFNRGKALLADKAAGKAAGAKKAARSATKQALAEKRKR